MIIECKESGVQLNSMRLLFSRSSLAHLSNLFFFFFLAVSPLYHNLLRLCSGNLHHEAILLKHKKATIFHCYADDYIIISANRQENMRIVSLSTTIAKKWKQSIYLADIINGNNCAIFE